MKSQILKIAGVKSEAAFYKKYPTEAAFFKAHPEAKSIKKAQNSASLQTDANANGIPDYLEMNPPSPTYGPQNNWNFGNNFTAPSPSFNTPSVGQMAGNAFQPAADPFATPNYAQQWAQNNPLPQQGTGKISNAVFGENKSATGGLGGKMSPDTGKGKGQGFNMPGVANVFTGAVEGFQALKAEKELTKKLNTWADVSDVVKKAGISNAYAEKPKRKWFRPDDQRFIHNTNEQYNTQGRGTDILATQNGGGIGGNPTELQNTYAPEHTLFDDLGYEPLEDSQQVKAYQSGGGFGAAWGQANSALSGSGDTSFMGNIGQGSPFDSLIGGQFGNNAGSKIGGSLGSLGGPIGSLFGTAIGGYFDKEGGKQAFQQSRINQNNNFIKNIDVANGITGGLSAMGVAENGGYMNPEYNPQVITMFGDHTAKDFADYAHKYRAGGHLREYTPPSERAMQTYENGGNISSYAMGGQLKTHWGGEANTIVKNPYLPGAGEIAMLRGASHDNGGIGISYGDTDNGQYQGYAENGADMGAQIEAEGGEPMIEMANGGSVNPNTGKPSTEAVVFGNIPFSAKLANATGDEGLISLGKKYDGKTYKAIIKDMAKPQDRANKTKLKASEIANDADNTKWGKLDLKTAQMMEQGADDTQLQFANYIKKLASLQNATQEVKKEVSYMKGKNISAEALGKGKIETDYDPITKDAELENPYAKSGAFLRKAQSGDKVVKGRGDKWSYTQAGNTGNPVWDDAQRYDQEWTPSVQKALFDKERSKKILDYINNSTGDESAKVKKSLNKFNTEEEKINFLLTQGTNKQVGPIHNVIDAAIKYTSPGMTTPLKEDKKEKKETIKTDTIPYERNKLVDIANMISPFFQNNKLPDLDPRQLAGEYMAIAQNQYEPVPSQQYAAELDPLYRVSYQDVRDQNTADFRDVERNNRYNPAAMAGLLGKKYLANNAVNAEEFRTNQAIENQIYGGNRAKINQERMTNLQLNADQMSKQEMAKSKTKETQQAAVASIADKYLQNDARNLEYNVYKNMFPQYGFNSSGQIRNQGPWYQPNIPQMYGNKASLKQVPVYAPDGKTIDHYELQPYDPDTTTETTTLPPGIVAAKKNGGKVTKNNRNSSIVKAYKNL